jgi:predicted nucleic-acid-binding protein
MISVDTNVLVRLLTKDDVPQYRKAYKLFQKEEIFVTDTVLLKTEWVLRFAYDYPPEAICDAFSKLFGLENVHGANPVVLYQAIEWHHQGMDFSDALHLANSRHCSLLCTFDKSFIKRADALSAFPVSLP